MEEWIGRYFDRIGIAPPQAADKAGLEAVMTAHRFSIPFENLDIPLGRGISIAPDAVVAKLVDARRGGYCFEQNSLFLRVMHAIGFEARPLAARVWARHEGDAPPRTHMINLVRLDGEESIVDVGFGGSFAPLLPLVPGREAITADGVRHRLVQAGEYGWMLERDPGSGWASQYSFTLDRVWPVDLEVSNHWTATRPETRFTTLRLASMPLADGLAALTDRTLTVTRRGIAEASEVEDAAAYAELLAEQFGIRLDAEEVAALGLF